MKKILSTLFISSLSLFAFSQNPNCVIYELFGNYSSIDATWESTTNQNTELSYLHTGATCPVYVGVGTNTPRSRLDVIGTTYTDNIAIGVDPQSMVGRFHMKIPVGDSYALQYDVFRIENADRQILNIDHTGLLRAREIKVDAEIWPDYVFEKDYELMSLEETEAYIQEHGHLPNVPSEEEVLENGQSLGEMNKVLLEKVEELTLHLIEQQKQIDELKSQLPKQ